MIYEINNEKVTVKISSLGAEMQEIVGADGTRFLCPAERSNWDGRAPILFPNTGAVIGKTVISGEEYSYCQHGFAKISEFTAEKAGKTSVTFVLSDNEGTRAVSPFCFSFSVTYKLEGNTLFVIAETKNTDRENEMLYSLGFHPGFSCPLSQDETAEDYEIRFENGMTADRLILQDGLVSGMVSQYWKGLKTLPITEGMFDGGSFSMTNLSSKTAELRSVKSGRGVRLCFEEYPNLVIWAPKKEKITNVCIEPWYGRPDSFFGGSELQEKPDTIRLIPQESKTLRFSMTFH